jgi:hypothetical protein
MTCWIGVLGDAAEAGASARACSAVVARHKDFNSWFAVMRTLQ